jgi:hypothetical protein
MTADLNVLDWTNCMVFVTDRMSRIKGISSTHSIRNDMSDIECELDEKE